MANDVGEAYPRRDDNLRSFFGKSLELWLALLSERDTPVSHDRLVGKGVGEGVGDGTLSRRRVVSSVLSPPRVMRDSLPIENPVISSGYYGLSKTRPCPASSPKTRTCEVEDAQLDKSIRKETGQVHISFAVPRHEPHFLFRVKCAFFC